MAKLSELSANGTSFHNSTIVTSIDNLIEVLGNPQFYENGREDKTKVEWNCETENGDVFTIYDWKESEPLNSRDLVSFHIGGKNWNITNQAKEEIDQLLLENLLK